MEIQHYTFDEHVHRFAIWTTARAASKSRLKNSEMEKLIDSVKLREEVAELANFEALNDQFFKTWIKRMGESMCSKVPDMSISEFKKKQFKFGIAAKIICIYIKTVEVLPKSGKSTLSKIAYPPIDSILLKKVNAKYKTGLKTTWSTFNWHDYERAIERILPLFPSDARWKIEVEWKVSDQEDLSKTANPFKSKSKQPKTDRVDKN